jgi:hypothetical protein
MLVVYDALFSLCNFFKTHSLVVLWGNQHIDMTILLVSVRLEGILNVANSVSSIASAVDNLDSLFDLLLLSGSACHAS